VYRLITINMGTEPDQFVLALVAPARLWQGFSEKLAACGFESVTLAYQPKSSEEYLVAPEARRGNHQCQRGCFMRLVAQLSELSGAVSRGEVVAHRVSGGTQRWLVISLLAGILVPLV
jgi:hypothetical protein